MSIDTEIRADGYRADARAYAAALGDARRQVDELRAALQSFLLGRPRRRLTIPDGKVVELRVGADEYDRALALAGVCGGTRRAVAVTAAGAPPHPVDRSGA